MLYYVFIFLHVCVCVCVSGSCCVGIIHFPDGCGWSDHGFGRSFAPWDTEHTSTQLPHWHSLNSSQDSIICMKRNFTLFRLLSYIYKNRQYYHDDFMVEDTDNFCWEEFSQNHLCWYPAWVGKKLLKIVSIENYLIHVLRITCVYLPHNEDAISHWWLCLWCSYLQSQH